MIIRANRGEYLHKKNKDTTPELVSIPDIESGTYYGIGDTNDFTNRVISIQSNLDYDLFCKNFALSQNPTERIEPLYIKKPNIT